MELTAKFMGLYKTCYQSLEGFTCGEGHLFVPPEPPEEHLSCPEKPLQRGHFGPNLRLALSTN